MQNYILIRVTEPDSEGSTHAGYLRRQIHRIAQESGIEIADNIIRQNRQTLYGGEPVPYDEAVELFKKLMPKGFSK